MFKLLYNQLQLKIRIRPLSGILIKSGQESGANPLLPSMSFVRSSHPDGGSTTVYIPGSSIKGVVRSYAEQMVRGYLPLVEYTDNRNSEQYRSETDAKRIYRETCTISRLFGSNAIASRIKFRDFYPQMPVNNLPIRQMVAIDRRSGSSSNTFTMEYAPAAIDDSPLYFEGTILLENFERWQLALLALVLRDLQRGYLSLGFGSSRGLGAIELHYQSIQVRYPTMYAFNRDERIECYLLGLAQLAKEEQIRDYGLHQSATLGENYAPESLSSITTEPMSLSIEDNHQAIEDALSSNMPDWLDYFEKNKLD